MTFKLRGISSIMSPLVCSRGLIGQARDLRAHTDRISGEREHHSLRCSSFFSFTWRGTPRQRDLTQT